MRRLFLSLAILAALLWAADFALGHALARLFHASSSDQGDRFARAVAYRPAIIVCGSSRAEHHYVVDSLETYLGVRAFNLGRAKSWGALYEYGAAGIVLRHFTPRLWIMEVEPGTYSEAERFGLLSTFEPYVREEPAAAELVDLRSRWERVKRISSIYPYNSLVAGLVAARVRHTARGRNGFTPLVGSLADDPAHGVVAGDAPVPLGHPAPDPLKMRYLAKTIANLRAHGVEVIAIRGPYWPPTALDQANNVQAKANLSEAFAQLGVRYFDFAVPPLPAMRDPALFRDVAHLNERGALVFTRALADSIRALPDAGRILQPEAN